MKTYHYSTQEIVDTLSGHGVKPSAQRLAILRFLMENRIHPTVDEIYQALLAEHPTLSRTTVYNTLKLFTAAGIIRCIDLGGTGGARWDYSQHDHAHFLCTSCGKITDIELSEGNPVMSLPSADYHILGMEINLKGLCPACHSAQAPHQA